MSRGYPLDVLWIIPPWISYGRPRSGHMDIPTTPRDLHPLEVHICPLRGHPCDIHGRIIHRSSRGYPRDIHNILDIYGMSMGCHLDDLWIVPPWISHGCSRSGHM